MFVEWSSIKASSSLNKFISSTLRSIGRQVACEWKRSNAIQMIITSSSPLAQSPATFPPSSFYPSYFSSSLRIPVLFFLLSLSLSRTIQCNHCPLVENASPIQKERNTRQSSRFSPFPNIFFSFIKRPFHTVSTTTDRPFTFAFHGGFHGAEGGPKKAMDSRGTRSHNARYLQM